MRVVMLLVVLAGARPMGCGATPLPADMDALPVVVADDDGAQTCMQWSNDDVTWMLIDASASGTTVRFNGCVEVTP